MFTVLAYLFPDNVPRPDILLVEGADLLAVFEPFERSLADRIRSGELVSAETIRIILVQLLVGLDYLHQNSILHGRISPFTLLEVAPNRFKISDLDRALAPPSFVSTLMMNDPLWTLSYFPPELLLSLGRAGPAVDIWAVGCLTIELWTSMRPFHVEPGDCLASIAGKMARCSAFPEPGDSVDMDLAEAIDPAS
ncbi:kinase-like domain-containing protein [Hyaloraphidium curvatum]|nr:kinase-like domain-containing protein [Hyaloraphidium curvatum]